MFAALGSLLYHFSRTSLRTENEDAEARTGCDLQHRPLPLNAEAQSSAQWPAVQPALSPSSSSIAPPHPSRSPTPLGDAPYTHESRGLSPSKTASKWRPRAASPVAAFPTPLGPP